MARILFLTQVLPYPLDAGPKIRAYYTLRHLARRHEVTLVSFVRPDDRPEALAHLESICGEVQAVPMRRSRLRDVRAVLEAAVRGMPVVIVRDQIAEMQEALRSLVGRQAYDVIHADQTSMAQYALWARAEAQKSRPSQRVPIVLDAHNALFRVFRQMQAQESAPLRRLALAREARALERYERFLWATFDQTAFVADADRLLAGRDTMADDGRLSTIPICIDAADRAPVALAPEPHLVTHLGTMFWPPNIDAVLWFAREVFPRVLERVPEARFVVIGKRPPEAVQRLGQSPHIDVLGYVPDPTPYLEQTAAFLVPLRAGAGMRVKILDAWCWGVPIVSTTLGADGIEAHDGEDLLIADDAAQYAAAVVRLLQEPDLRSRLGARGRAWVSERSDWQVTYARWDEIYAGLLGDGAGA